MTALIFHQGDGAGRRDRDGRRATGDCEAERAQARPSGRDAMRRDRAERALRPSFRPPSFRPSEPSPLAPRPQPSALSPSVPRPCVRLSTPSPCIHSPPTPCLSSPVPCSVCSPAPASPPINTVLLYFSSSKSQQCRAESELEARPGRPPRRRRPSVPSLLPIPSHSPPHPTIHLWLLTLPARD
jgi:hypothetical protein